MQGAQKLIGTFLLVAFVLAAGSIVCFASGQPSVVMDCGNQMSGSAICPFMSVSIPATVAASVGKETAVALMVVVVFVMIAAVYEDHRRKTIALSRYRHSYERPPISFLNSTLKLISEGVLHSRVFGS